MTSPVALLHSVQGLAVELVELPGTLAVPAALQTQPAFAQAVEQFGQLCERGVAFDGDIWVPERLDVVDRRVTLFCRRTKYSVGRGINAVNMLGHPTAGLLDLQDRLTGCLGVDTAVITNDGQVLIACRPAGAGKWPGYWFIGFGEGIGPGDAGPMANASLRCLKEELALHLAGTPAAQHVQVRVLAREETHTSWTGYAVADLRGMGVEYDAAVLVEGAQHAHDGWEAQALTAVPGDRLTEFLADKAVVPATRVLLAVVRQLLAAPSA